MKAINQQALFAEHWKTCDNSAAMLRTLLYAPQFVKPDRFDCYIDWLRQDLRTTTNAWLIEARLLDFEMRTIWSSASVKGDLLTGKIDEAEAKRRRRYGSIETSRLCSDLVATSKATDRELDKLWGRTARKDKDTESMCRAEQAAKLREIVGNPFFEV
jgi:hypothetical protein